MEENLTPQTIDQHDFELLQEAKRTMHNLSWAMRNVNKIGSVLESGANYIPEKVLKKVQKIIQSILMGIIKANLVTIKKNKTFSAPSKKTYKAIVTSTGALSGFFGSTTGLGTAIFTSELTLTTKFIMRTIMDIARSEGEDIYSLEGQMACLEVFALGGESNQDDGLETSYYTTRVALSSALKNVTSQGLKDSLVKSVGMFGSDALTKFVSKIATRASVHVSEKFLAQAVPIAGAVGGGSINYVFVNHFQNMATAHFTIKRLERKYGVALVQKTYENLPIEIKK